MPLIDTALRAEMLTAAVAAGASVVRVRASFLAANLAQGVRSSAVQPGRKIALLRCDPPPCVEVWVASDIELTSDWELA